MSEATIAQEATLEQAKQLGLLPEEFDHIKEILGRTPNFTELSVYSVMWSEHCSYKNSILWLKKLPRSGGRMLVGAGEENAGLMDIGDGLAVCFKIESHNHPSAIEPYQGAATGVGGIHRDIFTMGARPIASLDSLRFGNIDLPKTKHLLKGVVKGIGDYGNAFGIPTVGGEVYFDDCYNTNPLVNAMSVGIVKHNETASAIAIGDGNPVYIVGSRTGRDGIHGATFASGDITEDSVNDLPSVQVGDPFTEKLLLEATLEVIKTGAVVGIQDMGAAGITCSTSEMSAKGEAGMEIWLDKVPTREPGMKPFEILLSESQERMLIVVEKGREEEVTSVFEKWDLSCEEIGVVNSSGILNYYTQGELAASVPAESLVLGGGAPVYEREQAKPAYFEEIGKFNPNDISVPADAAEYKKIMEFLTTLPSLASKRWVTEQYDSMVGTANMSTNRPTDAALVNVYGTTKGLAVTTDCNSRYVMADPETGCAMAVSEAVRNIACTGGEPLGVTNCLNFGNPYNPEVYFQFANAIMGMKAACEKFNTPVTGGNVSFYNQSSFDGPVYPTPTIGMVGLLEDVDAELMTLDYKSAGDTIYLIGNNPEDIGCSEYVYSWHKIAKSPVPYFNLDEEYALYQALRRLTKERLVRSAHDLSEGGLTLALIEAGFPGQLGFRITTDAGMRKDAFLFGEAAGRAMVTVDAAGKAAFVQAMNDAGVPFSAIGEVTSGKVEIDGDDMGTISHYHSLYMNALENRIFGNK